MPSLKDLRNRIASVKSTQKITKAMQMVAVAKLRRAQAAAESARPYAQRIETVLANLAGGAGEGAQGPRLLTGTGARGRQRCGRCPLSATPYGSSARRNGRSRPATSPAISSSRP